MSVAPLKTAPCLLLQGRSDPNVMSGLMGQPRAGEQLAGCVCARAHLCCRAHKRAPRLTTGGGAAAETGGRHGWWNCISRVFELSDAGQLGCTGREPGRPALRLARAAGCGTKEDGYSIGLAARGLRPSLHLTDDQAKAQLGDHQGTREPGHRGWEGVLGESEAVATSWNLLG